MAKIKPPTRREKLQRCLRAARMARGLSQEQAAKLIGTTRASYGDWERNPDMIQLGKLRLVCLALDLDIAELVNIK